MDNTNSQELDNNSNFPVNFVRNHNVNASINTPNEHGNVPLHTAALKNDVEMLEYVLAQPNINVNYKNYKDETSLFISLCRFRSNSFVERLIEAGCNPNISNKYGETPLHIAVLRDSNDIAHKLIKRNAKCNTIEKTQGSPLHYAVNNDNLEAVCMLLYYGADVTVLNKNAATPLVWALTLEMRSIAEVLFNFYDDFSCTDVDGCTALHLAAQNKNPLALKLVKAGANVNCGTYIEEYPIELSLGFDNADLFKLIWQRLDYTTLLDYAVPFFVRFVYEHNFSPSEYVECLYLILQLSEASDLLSRLFETSSFEDILIDFHRFDIEYSDRMAILNICLGMGYQATFKHLYLARKLYGDADELEALIYNFNGNYERKEYTSSFLSLVLGAESFKPPAILIKLILDDSDLSFYRHFSVNSREKKILKKFLEGPSAERELAFNRLSVMNEFPSLLELSRNATCRFVNDKFEITRRYQYRDIIKKLKVPQLIKDIIRFKVPIY